MTSRWTRAAPRSLVRTTRPCDTAGHVPLPAPVSCSAGDHELPESVAVKTFQRQSAERESYQTRAESEGWAIGVRGKVDGTFAR